MKPILKSNNLFGVSLIALLTSGAGAQDSENVANAFMVDEIVVTGSRLPSDLTSFAGSVSLISLEDLQKQTRITSDLGEILGNSVPGMAVSKGNSASNFAQTLRGRKPAVLIDGAPQTVPLREAGRDIRLISPAAIGQIEVIRGSTALYGMGGAGGVINYITKRPTDDGYQFRTDLGLSSSLTKVNEDSFTYEVAQSITGKEGAFDFIVTAMYEDTGQVFDADGTMIAPDPEIGQGGTSEVETTSLFIKLGYDIDESQRIEGSYGRYRAAQETDYFYNFLDFTSPHQTVILKSDLGVGGYEEGYLVDPRTNNDFATLAYSHEDIMGSSVRLSGSYQKYAAVFGNTPFFLWGLAPRETNPLGGGQTQLLSEKYGLRLDVDTPIEAMNGRLLWGVDYLTDTTAQDIYDSGEYYLSPVDQEDISLFAQFEGDVIDGVNIRGGMRWVNFKADVNDYTTIPFYLNGYVEDGQVIGGTATLGGNAVEGGTLKYNVFLPNFGVLVDVAESWKVFGSYSKGFVIADLGRTLRDRFFDSDIATLQNDPQVVTTFEGGLRGAYGDVSLELAAYRSMSDAGTTLAPIEGTTVLQVIRSPERIWGVEASLDWQVNDDVSLAASYTWVDGKFDPQDDGTFEQMNSYRIPPQKLIAQATYEFASDWSVFVQGLYSFDHTPFGDTISTPGRNPIDSFFLLDASVTGKVGSGYLSISVSNLLNKDYEPLVSQAIRNDPQQFFKAPGAELSIRYSIEY